VDGFTGKEANTALIVLEKATAKASKPFSQICRFLTLRLSSTIIIVIQLCLHGSRFPSSRMINHHPQLEYISIKTYTSMEEIEFQV
jgi:hypothetical protein